MRAIWGSYGDDGKENGNYYLSVVVHVGVSQKQGVPFWGVPLKKSISIICGGLYCVILFWETTILRDWLGL